MKAPGTVFFHPRYRPDIDGLRAIAVLAVVMFHGFPGWFKGGFIGVDIFFVISGYLISTIIFKNLENHTFSFYEFYFRRILRIFPALSLVLVACFSFGWTALLSDEYKQLGKHIAAGAGFVSNLVLWNESGYFDNSAETKPLLHLWSLGVEEQFYIVWPLVLWLAWKKNFNLLTVTIALAIASISLNLKFVSDDPVATFYSPLTRFWELLSGSLLAWVFLYKKDILGKRLLKVDHWLASVVYTQRNNSDGKTLADIISLLGFFILLYGFWRIDKGLAFPGAWALIPVSGAVLIIAAGSDAWINRKILSSKIAIWFGLISFPLYLWHWPLLSFARIVEGESLSRTLRIGAVLLSVILAWLTYRLVERPIRFGSHEKLKVTILVALMVAIGYVGFNTYERNGLEFRTVTKINASINSGYDGGDEGNIVRGCGLRDESMDKLFPVCLKDKRGSVRFALMGDSKAAALYPGLIRTSDDNGRWLVIAGHGANGAPAPLLASDPDPDRPLTNYAIEAISNSKNIETVVLVTAIRAIFSLSDGVANGNLATYDYNYLDRLNSSNRLEDSFAEIDRVIRKFILSEKK